MHDQLKAAPRLVRWLGPIFVARTTLNADDELVRSEAVAPLSLEGQAPSPNREKLECPKTVCVQ